MAGRQIQPVLAKAHAALDRGQSADVTRTLARELKVRGLQRADELALRCALTEAWLLEGDVRQAAKALGPPPSSTRDHLEPVRLSILWRLHGRVAAMLGEQSRAIALLGRALKLADRSYDTRAIGLAHYELALCYSTLGDAATVREHLARAADALRAADDRRHLALVRSLIGVSMAQEDRFDEALEALGQAERIASSTQAEDVVAIVSGNQANVALMRHQYDQALALAERSVTLHERSGTHHGLGVALATLGQICIRLGDLSRARQVLTRALQARSASHVHETTGAVYDSLAQIHLIQGDYDQVEACVKHAWEAYGEPMSDGEPLVRVVPVRHRRHAGTPAWSGRGRVQQGHRDRSNDWCPGARRRAGRAHRRRGLARGGPNGRSRATTLRRGGASRPRLDARGVGRVPEAAGAARD